MPSSDCPSTDRDLLERHLNGGDPRASIKVSEAGGAVYTLEAVMERTDSGEFKVKSRIERSEAPLPPEP